MEAEIEAIEKLINYAGSSCRSALAAGDQPLANYWLEEKRALRKEKRRLLKLLDRKMFILKSIVPAVVWEGSQPVDELLKYYGKSAATARTIRTYDQKELNLYRDDLGYGNFEVLGRDEAYEALLEGAGSMFRNFLRPKEWLVEHQREGDFYFAMVAFPGAGKSTIGRRGWEFLSRFWNNWTDEKKKTLLQLTDADYELFRRAAASSLEYDLCMYHTVAHQEGGVAREERGLAAAQILALRCLYSILHRDNITRMYDEFLLALEKNCPGLKLHLKFTDVLIFLRRALSVDSDTWLIPYFFFDELNAITRTLDDQVAGPGKPNWFKSVMSQFVGESHRLALSKAHTLPVITLASTRSSAGDLKFTECAKAKAKIVPLPPLTFEVSRLVVLGFANRLAESLKQPQVLKLGKWVEDFLLTVAGGMPRILGLGLGSICSKTTRSEVLLDLLRADELAYDEVKRILDHWECLVVTSYYYRYWGDERKKVLLLRALAASLLDVEVRRDEVIHSEFEQVEENLWGSLEDAGLVSLSRGGSAVNLGSVPVPVRCSPYLVKALGQLLEDELQLSWPSVRSKDSKEKEKSDARAVLLRAYLKDKSYGEQQFKLKNVLPSGSLIPYRFREVVFKLVKRQYMLDTSKVQQNCMRDVRKLRERARDTSALLGPGNLGADSFIFCNIVSPKEWANKEVMLINQSKQTISDVNEVASVLSTNFEKDVGILFTLPECSKEDLEDVRTRMETGATSRSYVTRGSKRRQVVGESNEAAKDMDAEDAEPGEYAYIFHTNRPITESLKTKIECLQEFHPYFSRSIFCFEQDAMEHGDALSVLAQLRIFSAFIF